MNIDAIELAYEAALALGADLLTLAGRLTLPDPYGANLRLAANLVVTVLAPAMITGSDVAEVAGQIADQAVTAGRQMLNVANGARDAAAAFYDAARAAAAAVPVVASPARRRALYWAQGLAGAAEASFLAQAFVCEANSDFADRQSAVEARSRISAALDGAADRIAAAIGMDVWGSVAESGHQATQYLVAAASELRPIVRIEATRSFPSTALAWSLYSDPRRAAELVARNRCGTPLFMPAVFEALSPDAT